MDFKIVKSRRKTCTIQVKPNGDVLVKAPLYMPKSEIIKFVDSKRNWIEVSREKLAKLQSEREGLEPINVEEMKALAERALIIIPQKVKYYSAIIGVTYGKITVRNQKTRWGSCTRDGNLNFNCLLMLTPEEVIDYVIVHELCHRKHMDHSAKFWAEVEKVLPEYKTSYKWLKANGGNLIHRMLAAKNK